MDDRLREELLRSLRDRIDVRKLDRTNSETARDEVLVLIRDFLNREAVPLSFAERERLTREILDEVFGLGPLESLLNDPGVADILVTRFDRVYVQRDGELELTSYKFQDNQHLMQIIDRILSRIGRSIDESSPLVDVWLGDGSRLNVVIPPLGRPSLSIRRFGRNLVTARQMVESENAPSIEPNKRRAVHGIAVALLTEDREQQVILQNHVEATQAASIVFSHVGFPLGATDPVLRQMQDRRAEVVIVDINPDDPQRAIHTIELIRETTSDIAIFAVGEIRNASTIVSAMRAGAREFIKRPTNTTDLLEAFIRLSGVRRKTPSESGGSMPPGGSAPPTGSTPSGVPLGVPRSIRPRTPPPKKMARGA